MTPLVSYWRGGGRSPGSRIEGYGELLGLSDERALVRDAETGETVDVHRNCLTEEPTPEEIAERTAELRQKHLQMMRSR